eukprot:3261410-Alexandrium_andersonii.AAC.1
MAGAQANVQVRAVSPISPRRRGEEPALRRREHGSAREQASMRDVALSKHAIAGAVVAEAAPEEA